MVFLNGKVITVDSGNTVTEGLAIAGGRILKAGRNEEIREWVRPNTKRVDLAGRALVPGFIDAHCHLIVYGLNLQQIDCSYPSVRSIRDILEKVREKATMTPEGEWIQGWGYDEFCLQENRYPTRSELDRVAPNHLVVLTRTCIHACVANSLALHKANIRKETPNPSGGEIVRDPSTGEPTGLLREMPGMELIESVMPMPDTQRLRKAIKKASETFIREGITSVHDAGVGAKNPADIKAYQEAFDEDRIPLRVYLTIREYTYTKLGFAEGGLGIHTGFGNDWLKLGPVKVILDGSIGARTAAIKVPYEGEECERGFLIIPPEDLYKKLEKAHRNGFQFSIHAIGDEALDTAITCYESVLKKFPRGDHRHRIEHFSCATPDLVERAKKAGVLPVVQPTFIHRLGESYQKNLGDRVKHVIPCKSLIQSGMNPAGSSDRPVVPGSPLLGIYSAVTRKTENGQVIAPAERVSPMQALRMFTLNGAYASFEEGLKGSLEQGKLADLVVLSQDPLTIPPEEIKDVQVEMTVVDGNVVYTSKTFRA